MLGCNVFEPQTMTNKSLSVDLTKGLETWGPPIIITPGDTITIVATAKQKKLQSEQVSLTLQPEGRGLYSISNLNLATTFYISDYPRGIEISEGEPRIAASPLLLPEMLEHKKPLVKSQ